MNDFWREFVFGVALILFCIIVVGLLAGLWIHWPYGVMIQLSLGAVALIFQQLVFANERRIRRGC